MCSLTRFLGLLRNGLGEALSQQSFVAGALAGLNWGRRSVKVVFCPMGLALGVGKINYAVLMQLGSL